MRSNRSGLTSERGQSTAFVSALLLVLVLFVGVVANVGQVVNRRIALQIVADTGAYTGAATMATGLNQLAHWNWWKQTLWITFSSTMVSAFKLGAHPLCKVADAQVKAYKGLYKAPSFAFQLANRAYANYPYVQARRVSEANANHLFPGETLSYGEWSPDPETGIVWFQRDLTNLMDTEEVEDGVWPAIGPLWTRLLGSPSRKTLIYGCGIPAPPFVLPRADKLPLWHKKSDEDPKHFVWIVKAPARPVAMFDGLFRQLGITPMPEMRAIAVAKPVNGSIVDGSSEYITKMVPAGRATLVKGVIRDSLYDRGFRLVTH